MPSAPSAGVVAVLETLSVFGLILSCAAALWATVMAYVAKQAAEDAVAARDVAAFHAQQAEVQARQIIAPSESFPGQQAGRRAWGSE